MKHTFTKRVLLFFFLVIPIPLLLNLMVVGFFSFSAAKANLVQVLHTHATNLSIEFDKKLTIHKLFLNRLANTLALKSYGAPSTEPYTQAYNEMMALSDTEFSLCLIDPFDGSIKTKNPGDPFIRYLKQHPEMKKKLSIAAGKAFLLTIPAEPLLHYLILVEDIESWDSPTTAGLLVSFYPMSFLQKDLFQSLHITKGNICLVNKYGEVLFCAQNCGTPSAFSLDLPNLPQLQPRSSSAVEIQKAPSILGGENLVSMIINNKRYIGLVLNKIPIQGIFTLSLIPVSDLIYSTLKLPLNICLFYVLAFLLMWWIFSKISTRLNKPLQELTFCMEAAWRGNHNVRFEPQPYGYEFNELGNIFNCTLLLLLNSIEKADIDYQSGEKLQKELGILSSLQSALLSPDFPTFSKVTFSSQHLRGKQLSGHFNGWTVRDDGHTLLGIIGLAGAIGLPSYLYALSARSLFLAYASLDSSLQKISTDTAESFSKTTEGNEATVAMTFIKYSGEDRSIELLSLSEGAPTIFLQRGESFLRLPLQTHETLQPGDRLICVTGDQDIVNYFSQLPIEELLKDPLDPLNTDNLIDSLTMILNNETEHSADGTLTVLSFS
ncbi:regulator of sigma subunit [Candidatus Chlamydia corallus]|uniref:regulator of sigma subunit n=1 Tax=Candidatus Chlamydia corallus TaxID=2038470 RepID=UPI000C2FA538|nr:regulator of sigma subunit [Candidatus Chlamydia corallus]